MNILSILSKRYLNGITIISVLDFFFLVLLHLPHIYTMDFGQNVILLAIRLLIGLGQQPVLNIHRTNTNTERFNLSVRSALISGIATKLRLKPVISSANLFTLIAVIPGINHLAGVLLFFWLQQPLAPHPSPATTSISIKHPSPASPRVVTWQFSLRLPIQR